MVFSFPINPGLDEIERRVVEPGSCYSPRPFLPRTSDLRWSRAADRETARALAEQRTEETLQSNLLLQTHPWLGNVDKGFFPGAHHLVQRVARGTPVRADEG